MVRRHVPASSAWSWRPPLLGDARSPLWRFLATAAQFVQYRRWDVPTPTGFRMRDVPPDALGKRRAHWHRVLFVPSGVYQRPSWKIGRDGRRADRSRIVVRGRPIEPSRSRGDKRKSRPAGASLLQRSGSAAYLATTTKWPRRLRAQHASVSSVQSGDSSPLLSTTRRSAAMPRLTR